MSWLQRDLLTSFDITVFHLQSVKDAVLSFASYGQVTGSNVSSLDPLLPCYALEP